LGRQPRKKKGGPTPEIAENGIHVGVWGDGETSENLRPFEGGPVGGKGGSILPLSKKRSAHLFNKRQKGRKAKSQFEGQKEGGTVVTKEKGEEPNLTNPGQRV